MTPGRAPAARGNGVIHMSGRPGPRIPAPSVDRLLDLPPGAIAGSLYARQLCWHGRQAVRRGQIAWSFHLRDCPRCIVGARNFFLSQRTHGPSEEGARA